MKKYIINKITKELFSEIERENWVFDSKIFELIETSEIPNQIKNVWNGMVWIEGLTTQELESIETEKVNKYRAEIYDIAERLYHSAKEKSLGKVGQNLSKNQLEQLEKQYEVKKEVAERIVSDLPNMNQVIYDLINFEQENDFPNDSLLNTVKFLNKTYNANIPTENVGRIKLYAYLILVKFDLGKHQDSMFTDLIEYFRSKLITWLDYKQYAKLEAGKLIVTSVISNHNFDDILTIKNQFDQL